MPRTRQGGNRSGTPGQSYPNRTDIRQQPSLPARAAPGQTYGTAQSQLQAQKMVPMAPPRIALPQPVAPPTGPAGAAPGSATPGAGPAAPFIPPGGFGDIHRPTERPLEPVTSGAALGPGPGPEALGGPPQQAQVSALLQRAAASTGSNVLSQMAQRAAAAGQ